MNTREFSQHADDPEWWTHPTYPVSDKRPPISVTATTGGEPPDEQYVKMMVSKLADVDTLVLAAAEHILNNYSYDHFKSLGVHEECLVKEETPEAIADAVKLESAWFNDPEGDSFELSFSAPWDDHHSFDVEFDDGEATCCSVNG